MTDTPQNSEQPSRLQKAAYALKEMRAELDAVKQSHREPIAIVGMSGRFPGASNCDEFWELLYNGVDAVTEIPPERWSLAQYYDPNHNAAGKMNARCGGFLSQVDHFDPAFFGIPAREAVKMDPQQRLLLEVTWEALEDAGQAPQGLAGTQTGTYIGINQMDYALKQFDAEADMDIYTTTGNGFCFSSGRISYALGLQGPNMAIDTACSSSLVAVHLACQGLRTRECDMAVAGGVQLNLIPTFHLLLAKTQSLAPSGRCNTFSAAADGLIMGEGCGIVVLKRLADAVADQDRVLALIRASGVNHGGSGSGITVPSEVAQEALVRQVLDRGQTDPADVGFVETHGTGTLLGDPIEVGALSSIFCERPKDDPLVLGSVKTNIGHLDAAAGIAGLIKAVLCLQRQQIPPNLHFDVPNPRIDWDTCPLKIPLETLPWPRGEKPRCAGVSSFGFSGTNSHMLLAEAPDNSSVEPRAKDAPERPLHILTLSAKSDKALYQLARAYATYLESPTLPGIADICFTANAGRSHFNHRLAVVVDSLGSLQEQLSAWGQNGKAGIWHNELPEQAREPLKIACIFSGAEIDLAGPGRQLYTTHPGFRATIDRCSAALDGQLERPLSAFFASGESESGADSTAFCHAALLALEYALFELWRSWNIGPAAVAGWGVGEYAAACAAGIFSLADGLRLVVERGKLLDAIDSSSAAEAELKHFARSVTQVSSHKPRLAVVGGLKGELLPAHAAPDAEYWRQQVRAAEPKSGWLEPLIEKGCHHFLEIGPCFAATEQALSTHRGELVLGSLDHAGDDWRAILSSLARLYAHGLDIAWDQFDRDYPRRRQALPTYPFQRQRYWFEADEQEETAAPAAQASPGPLTPAPAQQADAAPPAERPSRSIPAANGGATALSRIMAQQLQAASATISQVVAQQLEFLRPEVQPTAAAPPSERRPAENPETEEASRAHPGSGEQTTPATEHRPVAEEEEQTEAEGSEALPREASASAASQLLLISAPAAAELDEETQRVAERLQQAPGHLTKIAASLWESVPLAHRRMLVCQDANDAVAALASLDPKRVVTHVPRAVERPIAFMFPGVGDHYVDMAREFYQTEKLFRDHIDMCCEWILPHLGEDLRQVIYPETGGKADEQAGSGGFDLRRMLNRAPIDENSRKLSQTLFNQPAVFIIEYALARLWTSWGVVPQALIGYSVGEYVAACLAGVMALEDALLLLTRRAQMIQDLPAGSMLAVPLSEDEIRPLLDEALSICIISTPSQCVVGGPPEAVERLELLLQERDVLCRELPTTHAFHSRMLESLSQPMTELVGSIRLAEPRIPFLSNVSGTWITSAQATDPRYWAKHTYRTLRFADGVGELLQTPDRILLEVGPGQNLSSFVFQHPAFKKDRGFVVLPSLRNGYDGQADRTFLLHTLGKLWLSGMELDWASILGAHP